MQGPYLYSHRSETIFLQRAISNSQRQEREKQALCVCVGGGGPIEGEVCFIEDDMTEINCQSLSSKTLIKPLDDAC